MGDMDDIVKDFLVESNENLDQLDRDLVTLEKDPTARDILASIFRTIHTIKGTTGFLGFSKLESVAHVGENLLSGLRDGRLLLDAEITSALLAMVDAIRQMLASIEATGKEGDGEYGSLNENLSRLQAGEKQTPPPAPSDASPAANQYSPPADANEPNPETANPAPAPPLGEILVQTGAAHSDQVDEALKLQHDGDRRRLGEILVETGAIKPAAVQ